MNVRRSRAQLPRRRLALAAAALCALVLAATPQAWADDPVVPTDTTTVTTTPSTDSVTVAPDPAPVQTKPAPKPAPKPAAKPAARKSPAPTATRSVTPSPRTVTPAPTPVVRAPVAPVRAVTPSARTVKRTAVARPAKVRRAQKPKAKAKPAKKRLPSPASKARRTAPFVPPVAKKKPRPTGTPAPARRPAPQPTAASSNSSSWLLAVLGLVMGILIASIASIWWHRSRGRRQAEGPGGDELHLVRLDANGAPAPQAAAPRLEPASPQPRYAPAPRLEPAPQQPHPTSPHRLDPARTVVADAAWMPTTKPSRAETPVAIPDVCEIGVWRGYLKWRFYASIQAGGIERSLAESAAFKAPGEEIPEPTETARRAYDELVARLAAEGWELNGQSSSWFGRRLVRAATSQHA